MQIGQPAAPEHGDRDSQGVSAFNSKFLPWNARIFWLLTLAGMLLTLILLALPARAQISPGPLSRAHHELDGPTGCVRCHALSPGSPTFRCLDCHTEIATRLLQKRGMHALYMSEPKASCVRCHSEHNGTQFMLIRWDPSPAKFDHSKTGFVLEGKHVALSCAKCHNTNHIATAERTRIQFKDANRSYLGLGKSCTSCHVDKHQGQLGPNCTQCHNSEDWKDAKNFDHSKTKFVLTGAHSRVECKQCHVTASAGVPKYVGLEFRRCSSCHKDPHGGSFRQTCESCHSTASWKRTNVAEEFDHSKTRYPLEGRHLDVTCVSCHRGGNFKTALVHDDCRDCHRPDPHGGQFLARADGGRCESCHSVQGFRPAKYTVADHQKTTFQLVEGHASLACAKCHTPAGRATVFKIKLTTCVGCHQDVHKGQFSGSPYLNRCEQCHNQTTFHSTGFDLAWHQKTRFALTGGHVAVACNDCHKPTGSDGKSARFHFEGLSCTSCHVDPHKGQFLARMQTPDASGRVQGCEACHSTKAWRDLTRFDHSSTHFVLTGTHRAVDCIACHRPPNLEHRMTNVDFRSAPEKCEECHENVHGRQFNQTDGVTRCASCHNTTKWRPSLFDHSKSAFALDGGHKDVRCGACHKTRQEFEGRLVLVYKPTPVKCADCHGNSMIKAAL